MSLKLGVKAVAEWRGNWLVVVASALGVGLMTAPSYSVGVFVTSLEAEFGWTRAAISSGLLVSAAAAITFGPFVGMAVDRVGPRRIALVGSTLVCSAFALMSMATPSLWSWWAIWVFMALAAVLIKPMVWTAAVSSLFTASRGLALAVALCGTSLASTVTPILCSYLIRSFGWRTGYLGLAAFFAVLVLPAVFLFFTSALDQHRSSAAKGASEEKAILSGVSAREGLTSFRFIRLTIAGSLIPLVAGASMINFVPIMISFGHSQMTAATVASLAGLSTVAGRLIGGYLLDRINGNLVAGACMITPIASTLLFLFLPGSVTAASAAALILGLSVGAELDAVAYLTTRHFGLRSYGVLFAVVGAALSLTTAIGPVIFNHIYDVSGSYIPALWGFIPLCFLGAALFFTLGRYPDFGDATYPSEATRRGVDPVAADPLPVSDLN